MLILCEEKGGDRMNLFFVFLGTAAWQDLRTRSISLEVLSLIHIWHLDFTKLKLTFGQNSEIIGAHSEMSSSFLDSRCMTGSFAGCPDSGHEIRVTY